MNMIVAGRYTLTVDVKPVDVTCSHPSPNEHWKFSDANGHKHRYDRGYPTLELVVDSEHWCDGNEGYAHHDPHMQVDESHYECRECRQVIEPAMDPPFTPKLIPGTVTAILDGPTPLVGVTQKVWLLPAELDALRASGPNWDQAAMEMMGAIPADRVIEREYRS